MVEQESPKIPQIFDIINSLSSFDHFAFTTVSFSDTVLVFNENNEMLSHYFVTYLVEFAHQLFYKLLAIGVYYRGIITYGNFEYHELSHIDAYWGEALMETYTKEKEIHGFGLFIRKDISNDVVLMNTFPVEMDYYFIPLCQSLLGLYKRTLGILPIDINILTETDEFVRIDEDLMFLREIDYLRNEHPNCTVREKYSIVYNWYKKLCPMFFEKFEIEGFLPFTLNPNYYGSIDPFIINAEQEVKQIIQ